MAREITWHCTYCEGTNKYEDMHCVNCGAVRHIDTEFRSVEAPEEEKPKQTLSEQLDDIKELTGKAADIFDDVAPILGALTGIDSRVSRAKRRAKRFFE